VRRQLPREIDQGCRTTGYETRVRELCEEVLDTVCTPTKEVEYRKEIQERCDTRLQQRCNNTIKERPREVCKEITRTQCYHDIKLVPEVGYDHECQNIVQHICEERYHVPVPIPRPVPVTPAPIFTPSPTRAPRSYISPRPSLPPNKVKFPSTVVPRPAPSHKPSQRPRLRFRRDSQFGLRNAVKSGGRRPLVAHQELPSPPGCRSIVTQKCEKVPVKINRKLPDETCEEVPDIVCHLELESYEEPVCQNVAIEECEDVYKEIPFLVDDEKCEDIPRLECQEIEEEVPIQVCTSIDVNREAIIKNRGRTFTTQTKKPGAVVVGRLPPGEEEEEEERRGRVIQDTENTEDNGRPSSRKRKFVKLLRYLLEQVK